MCSTEQVKRGGAGTVAHDERRTICHRGTSCVEDPAAKNHSPGRVGQKQAVRRYGSSAEGQVTARNAYVACSGNVRSRDRAAGYHDLSGGQRQTANEKLGRKT